MAADCGGIIKKTIDEINEARAKEAKEDCKENDCYPHCDLNVWMRECSCETISPLEGITTGEIPLWLTGSLYRNGPGKLGVGECKFKHIFDGSAHLHRFDVKGGKATYQCRFLQSNTYKQNNLAQRITVTEFGTEATPDPCRSIFQRLAAIFTPSEISDNCMISIYPFADQLYTFTEGPVIHRIDPVTLDTLQQVDVSKYVNIVHHTSHPHVTETGLVYNIGLSMTPTGPKYSVVKFPKTEKGVRQPYEDVFSQASIETTLSTRWPLHPGYMHTFGITESYFIIVEQPMSVSIPNILTSKFVNRPGSSILSWFPEENTVIYLIDRKSGDLTFTFWAEPFFYLHIINQYEEDGHVIIDICLYKDPSMIDCMYIEAMKAAQSNPEYASMFRSRPMRFVLPLEINDSEENLVKLKGSKCKAWCLADGRVCVSPEILCDLGCETPRINYPLLLGKKYRYFYAISADVDLRNSGAIIKVDTEAKSAITWNEERAFPSEPVFVPSPDQKAEDDGVVLIALIWVGGLEDNKVALVVLDAKNLKELGRTTFITKGPVPKCLHGWFTSV